MTTTREGSVLWTLEEISRLVSQSGSPTETLGNIVHLIRRRFETDVYSVYLLESDRSARRSGRQGARDGAPRRSDPALLRARPGRLPRKWIARMKRAIRTLGWRFSADRMVMDYVLTSYIPAASGTSSDMNRF